jgi:phosphate transport system substrate-binding protein
MSKLFVATLLITVLVTASAAMGEPLDAFKDQKGVIDISGGTAHIPVMKEAAKRIMSTNPDIRITVAGGGSGVGVKQVGEGLVTIGNTGRPLKEDEISKYGLVSFAFAIDGVAVVVNPNNKIAALTTQQVMDIYSGVIKDWKELGGEPGAINVFGREDGSGTREVFAEIAIRKGELSPSINVVSSNGAMKIAVAQDKRAIGYVGIGHIDDSVKAPTFDGVIPSQENAAEGIYKVTRHLFMNTKGEPEGLTKLFIDYIFSPEGAEIIKESGYIPLPAEE